MTSSWIWNLKLWIANLTVFLLKAGEEVLVGGQAVFEGVMMRSPKSYSIAVRKPDGTIVVRSGKIEYGQGIRTGFAKIVVEELAVPLEKVRVELGETDRVPWDIGTFGSMSTAVDGKIIRDAAACARKILLKRASIRLE